MRFRELGASSKMLAFLCWAKLDRQRKGGEAGQLLRDRNEKGVTIKENGRDTDYMTKGQYFLAIASLRLTGGR